MNESLSNQNNLDENANDFLIKTTEESLAALERQKEQAPESSVVSIDAQIREKEKLLADLREKLV